MVKMQVLPSNRHFSKALEEKRPIPKSRDSLCPKGLARLSFRTIFVVILTIIPYFVYLTIRMEDSFEHWKSNDSAWVMTISSNISDSEKQKQNLTAPITLKYHIWNDTQMRMGPREHNLVMPGWLEYNGKALGDIDDASTAPLFVKTDDPREADIIIWISVMGCGKCEVPPTHTIEHAHKVIVLDYADGMNIHHKRPQLLVNKTELAYFKRSFVHKTPIGTFRSNCSRPEDGILPYAFSGSKFMMIPLNSLEANLNFQPVLSTEKPDGGQIYGAIANTTDTKSGDNADNGYFQDERYENFLVPFRNRKWTVTNQIRVGKKNLSRNKVVEWTLEHCKEKAGNPRNEYEARAAGEHKKGDGDGGGNYTAYIGEITGGKKHKEWHEEKKALGYGFGFNYLRHLRDAKIVVTCNPQFREGDYRLWEAFLSGAMVMVDTLYIPAWMNNPLRDGKHLVMYDPTNRTDFMSKLRYYSDPANVAEAEAIAYEGYEFVLRHHMPVDRVEYILDKVRSKLDDFVKDPVKRALFHLP